MDLSKSFSGHAPITNLAKKPEWYHRRPVSPHPHTACRNGSTLRPDEGAGMESGSYPNAALDPSLYHDGARGDLWCSGFYEPDDGDSSGEEDSDSSSDVIVFVSTSKQPLLCSSFVTDGDTLEPLSPAASSPGGGRGCCHRAELPSSPSRDSSSSEESSDSSTDIPPHHARPVVLLSDLSVAYADPAYSRVDVFSDDSDVVEVPVTPQRQNKRLSRQRSLENNDEQVQAPPTQLKRRKQPSLPRLPRHRLTRRAKKDAVGIYYESGDSDGVMMYALCSSSSDDARPRARTEAPPPLQAEAEQQHRRPLTAQRHKQTERSRRGHRAGRTAAASTRRRRRRRAAPALFSPPEALIKVRQPKRKKTTTADTFCPYVRVRRHLCTVVNHREDELTQDARQKTFTASSTGFLPKTSCFRLARHAVTDPATALCSLCGHVTNAQGLGDLHGPYYPDHAPSTSCGERERWIHEDCGVWSAGVFLVGGKLYGLEEAASLTRHTVCSACQRAGAIMGCSQKGCRRNYHYSCARHSGCVLNEDNLSMRCCQHQRQQRHKQSESRRSVR